MSTTPVFGSTNPAEGTCYTIPVTPTDMTGACELTAGTPIDALFVSTTTLSDRYKCKEACEAKGTDCSAY